MGRVCAWFVALLVVGCGGTSGTGGAGGAAGAGGSGGGGGAGGNEQCGCATFIGSLTLTVVDAKSGAVIEDATLSEAGMPLQTQCDGMRAADGGFACQDYNVYFNGHHVVTVSAPGYMSQTITVDIAPPGGGCCASGEMVKKTLALSPG